MNQSRPVGLDDVLFRTAEPFALPRLAEQAAQEGYRFTWVRTFHRPIVICIDVKPDGTGSATTKSLDGSPASGLGERIETHSAPISRAAVEGLRGALAAWDFWHAPTVVDQDRICLDGADWLLEGTCLGAYHAVYRWSPELSPFRESAMHMLDLAGVRDEEIY